MLWTFKIILFVEAEGLGVGSLLLICIETLSRPMVGLSHTLLPGFESGFLSHLLDDDGSSLAHIAIAVILLPGG